MAKLYEVFGGVDRFRERVKNIILEVKRIKKYNIDPLELLDRYYNEYTSEFLKIFKNINEARKFILKFKRRS